MTEFGREAKKFFDVWKGRILAAVHREPDLVDAAEILGYGEIRISVVDGKMKYVDLVPKMKLDGLGN